MANAFQDQFLKAGLVDSNKVKKANREKHKQTKQQQHTNTTATDAAKLQAQQASAQKAERDRELNRQKVELENKKALAAQIKQLVETHCAPKDDGDTPYNFQDANKIQRIYVTAATKEQIVRGELVIVRVGAGYELVPKQVAEKIAQRDASCVLTIKDAGQTTANEDEYAKYKVPDDLIW
ncbi:MAG: DUF2058 domain-containing protein [Gammaproteobacteria bacterium]|nr:DUF2058 domain-containing protein [Gammaproteobacteria bacterium]